MVCRVFAFLLLCFPIHLSLAQDGSSGLVDGWLPIFEGNLTPAITGSNVQQQCLGWVGAASYQEFAAGRVCPTFKFQWHFETACPGEELNNSDASTLGSGCAYRDLEAQAVGKWIENALERTCRFFCQQRECSRSGFDANSHNFCYAMADTDSSAQTYRLRNDGTAECRCGQ